MKKLSKGAWAGVAVATAGIAFGGYSVASATVDTSYYIVVETVSVPANSSSNVDAICAEGDTATGGGALLNNNNAGSYAGDQPWWQTGNTAVGWTGQFYNNTGSAQNGRTYVICKDT